MRNLYRSKAMCVWWMLRDMVGDQALKKALASYRREQDKERVLPAAIDPGADTERFGVVLRRLGLPRSRPAGFQSGVGVPTQDDDRCVSGDGDCRQRRCGREPKFRSRSNLPVEKSLKRIVVRGKSNAVIRVEIPKPPSEIVINDGSVPESDTTNNIFKIQAGDVAK
jgi:hypothetical protein